MSVKIHIIEDHLIEMLIALQGFGDLTEDEGERGHQIGAVHKNRSRNMKDNKKKADAHSRWESMEKNDEVRQRKIEVNVALKRKRKINVKEENLKNKKIVRSGKRASLLEMEVVETRLESLVSQRARHFVKQAPTRQGPLGVDFNL